MPLTNPPTLSAFSSSTTSNDTAVSTTEVTILPSNANRKGATIWNSSSGNLFIDFDGAVTTTSYAVKILPGGYHEVPFGFTGDLKGVWDLAVSGKALVREFI